MTKPIVNITIIIGNQIDKTVRASGKTDKPLLRLELNRNKYESGTNTIIDFHHHGKDAGKIKTKRALKIMPPNNKNVG